MTLSMNLRPFDVLARILRQGAGIELSIDRARIVEAQLAPILRRLRLSTVEELCHCLDDARAGDLEAQVLDALLNHETSWFRERTTFDALREVVLPELQGSRDRLSIWSAACSTGQEPYSLAMLLHDEFPELFDGNVHVLATDVSRPALLRAEHGLYDRLEMERGLPERVRIDHFRRQGASWKISDHLRSRVSFRHDNLAEPGTLGPGFDLVLLRNVLIYFTPQVKEGILRRVHQHLHPHGVVVLGQAEASLDIDDSLFIRSRIGTASVYRRV